MPGEPSFKVGEDVGELGRGVNRRLGDARERCAERRQLWPERRSDKRLVGRGDIKLLAKRVARLG